jgi:hypothetical protein
LKETFVLEKPKDGKLKWLIAEYAIWETKCTEKKARTAEEFLQEFVYMQQGRSYCKTYGCNVVRWIIWFYRGNYDGKGPVCREYTVHFSDKEIEDTWTMMKKNKDDAMEYKKQMEAKGTAA